MKSIKLITNSFSLLSLGLAVMMTACGGSSGEKAVTADSTAIKEKKDSVENVVLPDTIDGKPVKKTTAQLMTQMKQSPNWNKYQTGILPKMAEEVPEYCQKLLANEHDRFIIVDKAKMKLFLYDKYGNAEKEYGIACARNYGTKVKKGDSRTSDGFFSAEGIYDSTEWRFTNDAGYTNPARGVFGPRFIRLKIPNTTQIGIHGTSSPSSIGRRCSHGCIRVTNENILELVQYVEPGTPIIVSPGPRDIAVNEHEGRNIPSVTTVIGEPRATADSKMPETPMATTVKAGKTESTGSQAKPATSKAESTESIQTDSHEQESGVQPKSETQEVPAHEAPATPAAPASPTPVAPASPAAPEAPAE